MRLEGLHRGYFPNCLSVENFDWFPCKQFSGNLDLRDWYNEGLGGHGPSSTLLLPEIISTRTPGHVHARGRVREWYNHGLNGALLIGWQHRPCSPKFPCRHVTFVHPKFDLLFCGGTKQSLGQQTNLAAYPVSEPYLKRGHSVVCEHGGEIGEPNLLVESQFGLERGQSVMGKFGGDFTVRRGLIGKHYMERGGSLVGECCQLEVYRGMVGELRVERRSIVRIKNSL